MKFQLEIQQVERTCLFKLMWGKGQQISTMVSYPDTISRGYQTWHRAYLNFYKTALRARVRKPENDGKISLPQDRHRQLVQAEAQFLSEFHRWLRQEKLYEIRSKIASEGSKNNSPIALFLTCDGELQRLPWESWELGAEFGTTVAIARSPTNITNSQASTPKRPRKPRILAILGDDTGLDLKGDRSAMSSLRQVADLEFVTWEISQPAAEIKQQIKRALTDPLGWEVLFFAGHSNETAITGGELAIAPNIALSVSEIAPDLKTAQANGLQFALFNSCSGLSIANTLIDLGLSQVAVMREPVHNRVAQVFLIQFLRALAQYKNVQQALIDAEHHLQQQNLTYPSAYLIPSLFCHPDAQLYQIQPWGWQQQLKKWLPSHYEAIVASALCLLSIMPPLQNYLLNKRTLAQSVYRDVTRQLPINKAPITLVHIDEQSLTKAGIERPVPMDRSYLASLVDSLVAADAEIIGIDYLFDRTQPKNDPILAKSIADAVKQKQIWFVFGAYNQSDATEVGVSPLTNIGHPNWTLQGYTDSLPNYMRLLPESASCDRACPFAYLLSTIQEIKEKPDAPIPHLNNRVNLRNSIYSYVKNKRDYEFLQNTKLPQITTVVQYFGQQWLRPIQDFSIPPDLVYDRLPSWQLLEDNNVSLKAKSIIIGSGGYAEAGLTPGSDNFFKPNAIAYWEIRRGLNESDLPFTGSQLLAYMTHHWLERRLVVPIPDLWAVLTILIIAKGIKLNFADRTFAVKWFSILLPSMAAIYGLVVLQTYISGAILIPWLLPSIGAIAFLYPSTGDR